MSFHIPPPPYASAHNDAPTFMAFPDNNETNGLSPDHQPLILRPLTGGLLAPLLVMLVIATVVGVGATFLAVNGSLPFGTQSIDVWTTNLRAGTPHADPYSAAIYARTGHIPLTSGEGLGLIAKEDSSGEKLDPNCNYSIQGTTPPSRLWTLTATDKEYRLIPTNAHRSWLASNRLLRRPHGDFEITASSSAQSGNWLPFSKQSDGLIFILRLYDTPLATGSDLAKVDMPSIIRGSCS